MISNYPSRLQCGIFTYMSLKLLVNNLPALSMLQLIYESQMGQFQEIITIPSYR